MYSATVDDLLHTLVLRCAMSGLLIRLPGSGARARTETKAKPQKEDM
jgi:hypothetical protein